MLCDWSQSRCLAQCDTQQTVYFLLVSAKNFDVKGKNKLHFQSERITTQNGRIVEC